MRKLESSAQFRSFIWVGWNVRKLNTAYFYNPRLPNARNTSFLIRAKYTCQIAEVKEELEYQSLSVYCFIAPAKESL